jgi:DMSO reductase anchor subunit
MTGLQGMAGGIFVLLAIWSWTLGAGFVDSPARAVLAWSALALVAGGGMASAFHMHRWAGARYILRRLSTSWLSREVLTTALFGVAAAAAAAAPLVGGSGSEPALLSLAAALGLVAMWVTAMIYATIPAMLSWHTPLTVVGMMGTGVVAGGTLALSGLALVEGSVPAAAAVTLAAALAALALVKRMQWRRFGAARTRALSGESMGIPGRRFRLQDSSTSRPPYRTQPQVWPPLADARRRIVWSVLAAVAVLGMLLLLAVSVGANGVLATVLALVAILGTGVERWVFFADATHSSLGWITTGADSPWDESWSASRAD